MKELILDLWELNVGPRYKVPSSLFYCEGLTSLRLCNCSVNVSPTFRGFKNLKILYLQSVTLEDACDTGLKNLISGNDVLEDLSLINYNMYHFNFEMPKLKHFCFRGLLVGFGFGFIFSSTFCSPSFHMEFDENKLQSDARTGYINLLNFTAPLQSVETLKLDGAVLEFLSVKEVPAMLAEPLLLKNLYISGVHFKSGKELLVILCLLRSAPNLKQVKLLAAEKGNNIAEVVDCSGIEICDSLFTFTHLNSAVLTGIGDSALEMGFIGILLSSSPALQKMKIKAAKCSKLSPSGRVECKLLKNMMRHQCPSTQVELIFCDP